MELVTVVIPTFNRADLVRRAIVSVLEQEYQHIEVIVVDDASTDDTEDAVRSISDSRAVYLRHETNGGPSAARNSGIRAARGKFIGFLDSDDVWSPAKLRKQLMALADAPDAAYAYCGWRWISADTREILRQRTPDNASGLIQGRPRWMYNIVPDLLVRQAVAKRVLFREEIFSYENLDWLLRLGTARRAAFVPEILVTCYEHHGSRVSDDGMAKIVALRRILEEQAAVIRRFPEFEHKLTLALGALSVRYCHPEASAALRRAIHLAPTSLRSWYYLAQVTPGLGPLMRALRIA